MQLYLEVPKLFAHDFCKQVPAPKKEPTPAADKPLYTQDNTARPASLSKDAKLLALYRAMDMGA